MDDEDRPTQEELLSRLPELFELWGQFRDAEGPVNVASCLLEFSNRFAHLEWKWRDALELEDDTAAAGSGESGTVGPMDEDELVAAVDEARRYARLLYTGHRSGIWDYAAHGVPDDWDRWPRWLTGLPAYDGWETPPAPVAVSVERDYVLRVTFADGLVGWVDVAPMMVGPVWEPLRDPTYFAQAFVDQEIGSVAWPNETDIAPEVLYRVARDNPVTGPETTPGRA